MLQEAFSFMPADNQMQLSYYHEEAQMKNFIEELRLE